jgi:membrane associated rhomboid family serine protease
MLPLRDDQPRTLIPFVNWSIIAINTAVFVFEIQRGVAGTPASVHELQKQLAFLSHYAVVPEHFQLAFRGSPEYTVAGVFGTIFTSMFMHANVLHLVGNMWFLWLFGNTVEDHFGHVLYPMFYLLCGVIASMAQISAKPDSTLPQIGASGAIAGIMGGYLLRYTSAKIQVFSWLGYRAYVFWIPAAAMLAYWFALQLVSQLTTDWAAKELHRELGGVAYWAHLGGFLTGIVLIKVLSGRTRYAYGGWFDKQGKEMLPKQSTRV